MNHLKEIQAENLERLKQSLSKELIQNYYDSHTYKETAEYFKNAYGCSIANLRQLYSYFGIVRKGKGKNLHENREAVRQGMIAKYGVDNPQKSEAIRQKTINTSLVRYGVDNPMKSDFGKQRVKEAMLQKYGVENAFQSEVVKQQIKETVQERYGVSYAAQLDCVKQKARKTKLERYGDSGYHNIKKMRQTLQMRYGVQNPSQVPGAEDKARATCLKHYGVENPSRCREIHVKKAINTRNKSIAQDGTKFDSGWEVLVYEYATAKNYSIERQISIPYGSHVTFIDFRINGQLYEVKGPHLLNNCWEAYGERMDEKLACYSEHKVTIITDLAQVKAFYPNIKYIDIHDLNF